MTQFKGAVIQVQGATFAVVVVRPAVLKSTLQANQAMVSSQPVSSACRSS